MIGCNNPPVKIPILFTDFCEQDPLIINHRKLVNLRYAGIQISTTEIAWLLAIIEAKVPNFNSIDPENHNVLIRVEELRECLSIMLGEELRYFLEHNCIQEEMLWEATGILKKDAENSLENNKISEYITSWSVTRRILLRDSYTINLKQINADLKTQQKSHQKARRFSLDRTNMTDKIRNNLPKYCTNDPVKLNLSDFPESIWLKDFAYFLAISSKKLPDYGDVYYNDDSLLHSVKRIHDSLWRALKEKVNIIWTAFDVMPLAYRKLAENIGLIDIAQYGNMPEREIRDDWSALITRKLAFDILSQQPENALFSNIKDQTYSFDRSFEEGTEKSIKLDATSLDEKKIKEMIDYRLNRTLKHNIMDINPNYNRSIWDKTSAPHALILKTMCIMIELNYAKITWSTIKDFIEEHIFSDHERSSLVQLQHIDDYTLEVSEHIVRKISCQDRVSEYKKTVFNIK